MIAQFAIALHCMIMDLEPKGTAQAYMIEKTSSWNVHVLSPCRFLSLYYLYLLVVSEWSYSPYLGADVVQLYGVGREDIEVHDGWSVIDYTCFSLQFRLSGRRMGRRMCINL